MGTSSPTLPLGRSGIPAHSTQCGNCRLRPHRRAPQLAGPAPGKLTPTPPQARAVTQLSRGTALRCPKQLSNRRTPRPSRHTKRDATQAPPSPVLTRAPRRSFSKPRRPGSGSGSGSLTPAAHAPTSPLTAEQPSSCSARSLLAGACCWHNRL